MIVFPNAKINIGLHVVNKRPDGFHSLQTVFYPINWCDALEVITKRDAKNDFVFSSSGLPISGKTEDNILFKAWQLFKSQGFQLPSCELHLHKNIPMGAGLGGGSADGAFFIETINKQFELGLNESQKLKTASSLGSDCAFFLKNRPVFAQGRGDEFTDLMLDLSKFYVLIVYPQIHVNTKDAFAEVTPKIPNQNLFEIVESADVKEWRNLISNDFEKPIFKKYPEIEQLKTDLYSAGALYASLSGSGSAVYGIFDLEPQMALNADYRFYLQKPTV